MAITTEILTKLSTTAGTAGNSTAGTPATSLGKYISSRCSTAPPNARRAP